MSDTLGSALSRHFMRKQPGWKEEMSRGTGHFFVLPCVLTYESVLLHTYLSLTLPLMFAGAA